MTGVAVVAVGGFLFGFDTGVICGALLFVKDEFELNAFQPESVVSVLPLGAMAGAVSQCRHRLRPTGTQSELRAAGGRVRRRGSIGDRPRLPAGDSPTNIRGRILTLNQLMHVSAS